MKTAGMIGVDYRREYDSVNADTVVDIALRTTGANAGLQVTPRLLVADPLAYRALAAPYVMHEPVINQLRNILTNPDNEDPLSTVELILQQISSLPSSTAAEAYAFVRLKNISYDNRYRSKHYRWNELVDTRTARNSTPEFELALPMLPDPEAYRGRARQVMEESRVGWFQAGSGNRSSRVIEDALCYGAWVRSRTSSDFPRFIIDYLALQLNPLLAPGTTNQFAANTDPILPANSFVNMVKYLDTTQDTLDELATWLGIPAANVRNPLTVAEAMYQWMVDQTYTNALPAPTHTPNGAAAPVAGWDPNMHAPAVIEAERVMGINNRYLQLVDVVVNGIRPPAGTPLSDWLAEHEPETLVNPEGRELLQGNSPSPMETGPLMTQAEFDTLIESMLAAHPDRNAGASAFAYGETCPMLFTYLEPQRMTVSAVAGQNLTGLGQGSSRDLDTLSYATRDARSHGWLMFKTQVTVYNPIIRELLDDLTLTLWNLWMDAPQVAYRQLRMARIMADMGGATPLETLDKPELEWVIALQALNTYATMGVTVGTSTRVLSGAAGSTARAVWATGQANAIASGAIEDQLIAHVNLNWLRERFFETLPDYAASLSRPYTFTKASVVGLKNSLQTRYRTVLRREASLIAALQRVGAAYTRQMIAPFPMAKYIHAKSDLNRWAWTAEFEPYRVFYVQGDRMFQNPTQELAPYWTQAGAYLRATSAAERARIEREVAELTWVNVQGERIPQTLPLGIIHRHSPYNGVFTQESPRDAGRTVDILLNEAFWAQPDRIFTDLYQQAALVHRLVPTNQSLRLVDFTGGTWQNVFRNVVVCEPASSAAPTLSQISSPQCVTIEGADILKGNPIISGDLLGNPLSFGLQPPQLSASLPWSMM